MEHKGESATRNVETMSHLWSEPDLPAAPFTSPIQRRGYNGDETVSGSEPGPPSSGRQKETRNPSVTPRRFSRFFFGNPNAIRGRRILAGVNDASLNHRAVSPEPSPSNYMSSDPICPSSPCEQAGFPNSSSRKRRRVRLEGTSPSTPTRDSSSNEDIESPGRENEYSLPEIRPESGKRLKPRMNQLLKVSRGISQTPSSQGKSSIENRWIEGSGECNIESLFQKKIHQQQTPVKYIPKSVRKSTNRGFATQLIDREHGFSSRNGRFYLACPSDGDARSETAAFCTTRLDYYPLSALLPNQPDPLPFCLANFNSSPVSVVGDEHGNLRFMTPQTGKTHSEKRHVMDNVQAHENAILDIDISEDDLRLATAAGDRTSNILDVTTKTVAVTLDHQHDRSLRQIAFRPGSASGDILATSDQDGKIVIWDLRCSRMPAGTFTTWTDDSRLVVRPRKTDLSPLYALPFNSLPEAHPRKGLERTGKEIAASVTTIQWFPAGREHLMLSGSEANASVRLWDTRYIKPRNAASIPVAQTQPPRHHTFRPYGITCLTLSSDATRFYTVCKDSTVYAYSTAHLMLGEAQELVGDSNNRRKPYAAEGLGPLYGFKHEALSVGSFFIKSSLRPSRGSCSALLAVGSTHGSALLFPTDERYMRATWSEKNHIMTKAEEKSTPYGCVYAVNTPASLTPSNLDIPIYRSGTALVLGHSKEVTNVSWTQNGQLVTASDDGLVRYWSEDAKMASYLRKETDGQSVERWNGGWADVGEDWDSCETEC